VPHPMLGVRGDANIRERKSGNNIKKASRRKGVSSKREADHSFHHVSTTMNRRKSCKIEEGGSERTNYDKMERRRNPPGGGRMDMVHLRRARSSCLGREEREK